MNFFSQIIDNPYERFLPASPEAFSKFIERFDDVYTMSELVSFLKKLEFGKEQIWFGELSGHLKELIKPNEGFDGVLATFMGAQCILMALPRLLHLIVAVHIFTFQALVDEGIEKLSQLEAREESFRKSYGQVMMTAYQASVKLAIHNKIKIGSCERWVTVSFPKEKEFQLLGHGSEMVWKEFMEFLETKTDILEPPQVVGCVMM